MKKIITIAMAIMAIASTTQAQESIWEAGSFFGSGGEFQAVPPGMSLQKVATLTNDRDTKVNSLNVMFNDSRQLTGMYTDAGPAEGTVAWDRDIESDKGAVLLQAQGRKVLILQGRLNRDTQEGRFRISYLANGLTMRYENCEFISRKNGNGWYAQNAYNHQRVNTVKIKTHALGIKSLEGICP